MVSFFVRVLLYVAYERSVYRRSVMSTLRLALFPVMGNRRVSYNITVSNDSWELGMGWLLGFAQN